MIEYYVVYVLFPLFFFIASIFLIVDATKHKYSLSWVAGFILIFVIAFPYWLFSRKRLIEESKEYPINHGFLKVFIALLSVISAILYFGHMQEKELQLSACAEYK